MTIKKFLPVLLIIVGLFGLIPYNAQNDKKEITIQTLSQTHVNYKDVESYTQFIKQLSREAQETEKQRRLSNTKIELEKIAKTKAKAEEEARIAQEAEEEVSVAQEVAVASEPAYTEPIVTEVVQQAAPPYKRVQMVSTLMVDISILLGSLVLDKFQQTPTSIDGQQIPVTI